jgi:hypothetical protein
MAELKTRIKNDSVITENKRIYNYVNQMKSPVISNSHREIIINNLINEIKNDYKKSLNPMIYSKKSDIGYKISVYDNEISVQPEISKPVTGELITGSYIATTVNSNYIKSYKQNGILQMQSDGYCNKVQYPENLKVIIEASENMKKAISEENHSVNALSYGLNGKKSADTQRSHIQVSMRFGNENDNTDKSMYKRQLSYDSDFVYNSRNQENENIFSIKKCKAKKYYVQKYPQKTEFSEQSQIYRKDTPLSQITSAVNRNVVTQRIHNDVVNSVSDGRTVQTASEKAAVNRDTSVKTSAKLPKADEFALKQRRKKAYFRKMRMKQLHSKRHKYIAANSDKDDEITSPKGMYDTVSSSYHGIRQTSGVIYTSVRKTAKGFDAIATKVSKGQPLMRVGNLKSTVNIFTRVNKTIATGVKNGADDLLKTKIDKFKTTDTGMETINQAFTDLRYTTNAGKAVLNTGKAASKGIVTIYNMPKNTRRQIKTIKRNINKASNIAKHAASIIKNLIQSSTGKYLAVILLIFLLMQIVLNGFIAVSMTIQNSFSWLADDENLSRDVVEVVEDYEKVIKNYVNKKEKEIKDIYNNFECDRREYDGTEITEFRTQSFDIDKMKIDVKDRDRYSQILAICAVQRYRQLDTVKSENEFPELKFKDENIENIIDRFYKFEHGTRTGNCPHYECCQFGEIVTEYTEDISGQHILYNTHWYCDAYYHGCKEITKWIEKYSDGSWNWDTVWTGSRTYCDNSSHKYLTGSIENYSSDGVIYKLSFTEKEKELYKIYYEQIKAIFEEMD